jgi:proteic killer suppression protein
MLNNAQNLTDLKIPHSNKLEGLKGKAKDFYSIRINDQWRVVFRWQNTHAYEVAIVDHHK